VTGRIPNMSTLPDWTTRLNPNFSAANSRASAKDFNWFTRHPHRTYRLRRARPGEFDERPAWLPYAYAAVRQLIANDPDPRALCRVCIATNLPFTDFSEQAACDLWHQGATALQCDPEILASYDAAERLGRAVQ
jgi:hypothetical protein